MNPAMAGTTTYIPVRLTVRQQWVGIDGGYPKTYAVSGHASIANQHMGVGGYVFSDWFGPVGRTGIQASYAYHLGLEKIDSKLSFGVSLSAYQFSFDQSNFNPIEADDPALNYAIDGYIVPDANFGAYLYRSNYFVGVAGTQLFQYNIDITSSSANRMIRHYFVTGGYKFHLNDNFDLEPSVLVKATEKTPPQLDVNVKTYFKQNYWLAFSYRTGNAAVALLGVKYKQFYIGYAFDYTFSTLSNYTIGSHEFMLGVNFREEDTKGSSLL